MFLNFLYSDFDSQEVVLSLVIIMYRQCTQAKAVLSLKSHQSREVILTIEFEYNSQKAEA